MNVLFDLLALAFQNESLIVSIPALHSFTKLLVTKDSDLSAAMGQRLALLLGVCSQRLIRYESFLQDSENPVVTYLNEDFETLPELHAFLGNYRRYCITIIEGIACAMPQEAVTYILDQTVQMVDTICRDFYPPFSSKSRLSLLLNFLPSVTQTRTNYQHRCSTIQNSCTSPSARGAGFGAQKHPQRLWSVAFEVEWPRSWRGMRSDPCF